MKIKQTLVTPAMAKELLERNIHNRRLRNPYFKFLAKEMAEGRWKEGTGEAIKISKTGRLLDGQNRLHALIDANKSFEFIIVEELDDNVFDVLDTGMKRNGADILHIAGVKNSHVLSGILSTYLRLKDGYMIHSAQGTNTSSRVTNQDKLEEYNRRPKFWQNTAANTNRWYNNFGKILPGSTIGGFFAHFYDIDADDAEKFMEELFIGSQMTNKAISLLRNRLLQDFSNKITKLSPSHKSALLIKTWNYYRSSEEPKVLVYNPNKESYPKPI